MAQVEGSGADATLNVPLPLTSPNVYCCPGALRPTKPTGAQSTR
jgi:hypothetical protein